MANTPSLNASRRFFLCLIFAGLSVGHLASPIRAGRLLARPALIPCTNCGGRAPVRMPARRRSNAVASRQAARVLLVLLGAEGVLELRFLLVGEVGAHERGVRALDGGEELVLGHLAR